MTTTCVKNLPAILKGIEDLWGQIEVKPDHLSGRKPDGEEWAGPLAHILLLLPSLCRMTTMFFLCLVALSMCTIVEIKSKSCRSLSPRYKYNPHSLFSLGSKSFGLGTTAPRIVLSYRYFRHFNTVLFRLGNQPLGTFIFQHSPYMNHMVVNYLWLTIYLFVYIYLLWKIKRPGIKWTRVAKHGPRHNHTSIRPQVTHCPQQWVYNETIRKYLH